MVYGLWAWGDSGFERFSLVLASGFRDLGFRIRALGLLSLGWKRPGALTLQLFKGLGPR